MYKKCAFLLCLFMLFTGMCTVQAKDINLEQKIPENVFQMTVSELQAGCGEEELQKAFFFHDGTEHTPPSNRTVGYQVLVNENAVFLDEESYEILCKIVEAEAGSEDEKGRMLVANVVLNRVESGRFPNTVKGVVFQKKGGHFQFSPVANGRYDRTKVSEKTRAAVGKVLQGADESQGALYFVNRYATDPGAMSWFDTRCTPLFTHGRHEFFS